MLILTKPRKEIVSVIDTPYYHVVSRCVRRSFLSGYDKHTETSYEHRRDWLVDRMRLLSSIFAIDICAYAVMNNHYHICLKLNPKEAETWSDQEVAMRWATVFKGPLLFRKWAEGEKLTPAENDAVIDLINVYRERLKDLGWFMKCLNEPIAREANKEDGCKGHFWESRYKSQALLTEEALLSCMAYIDLNPIRAAIAETPENSDYTSVKERIYPTFNLEKAIQEQLAISSEYDIQLTLKPLAPFEGAVRVEKQSGILYNFADYLELVDWTGRIIKKNKRGAIPSHLSPILERLNITEKIWLQNTTKFEAIYYQKFRKRQIQTFKLAN